MKRQTQRPGNPRDESLARRLQRREFLRHAGLAAATLAGAGGFLAACSASPAPGSPAARSSPPAVDRDGPPDGKRTQGMVFGGRLEVKEPWIFGAIAGSGVAISLAELDAAERTSTNGWVMYDAESIWDESLPDTEHMLRSIKQFGKRARAHGFKVIQANYVAWSADHPVDWGAMCQFQAKYGDLIVAQNYDDGHCSRKWDRHMKRAASFGVPVVVNQLTQYGCVDESWRRVRRFVAGRWVWKT